MYGLDSLYQSFRVTWPPYYNFGLSLVLEAKLLVLASLGLGLVTVASALTFWPRP